MENKLMPNDTTFVKDNFYVEGVILCKYIQSKYSEELKKKIGKEKLKFDLVDNQINDAILNYLRSKELYFLRKTTESTEVKYPLNVKTFLKDDGDIILEEVGVSKLDNSLFVRKKFLEKTETSFMVSDKVTSISLKVDLDMNNKNIKHLKSTTKLSIMDLIELVKSENLKLRVQIKCGAVYKDGSLYISGTLTKISLEQSRMAQILTDIKEKETNDNKKKINLLPTDKLYISNYPAKSKTVSDNIVSALANVNDKNKKKK